MKVQKRDGRIVEYNADKITAAIKKANVEVDNSQKVSDALIEEAIGNVEKTDKEVIPVETIQDIIEKTLVAHNKYVLAKKYMIYRYQRSLLRKSNTTDESILKLIRNENKELAEENSNKNTNPVVKTLNPPKLKSYKKNTKKITGMATKGSVVKIKIGKKTYTVKVKKNGKFKVKLRKKLKKNQKIRVYAKKNGYKRSKTIVFKVK